MIKNDLSLFIQQKIVLTVAGPWSLFATLVFATETTLRCASTRDWTNFTQSEHLVSPLGPFAFSQYLHVSSPSSSTAIKDLGFEGVRRGSWCINDGDDWLLGVEWGAGAWELGFGAKHERLWCDDVVTALMVSNRTPCSRACDAMMDVRLLLNALTRC
jgi:hypothetical protein